MRTALTTLTSAQQASLVVLRTLVGWHFLYEGYVKLWWPAWSRDGVPLEHWSSAGYLRAASGPFAEIFHRLAQSSWLGTLDTVVATALLLVGLSLVLGLFTQLGCVGALGLLAVFYLSAIPTAGVHAMGAEGAYLLVNKNLVEASAVVVLFVFDTGHIAGLDLLRYQRRRGSEPVIEATA
jgi:thiosulfate dehydrogenase (quinone) large subunit